MYLLLIKTFSSFFCDIYTLNKDEKIKRREREGKKEI